MEWTERNRRLGTARTPRLLPGILRSQYTRGGISLRHESRILEYFPQDAEVGNHGDAFVGQVDLLVLQFLGMGMRDEHRAQARAERRVDI